MRGIGFLRLALAVLLVIVAIVPVQASTISYTGSDTTTLGNWRTAAPDADAKYGTDGYVLFNYLNWGGPGAYAASNDLAALPGYVSSYSINAVQGVDQQGTQGAALQDPRNVSDKHTAQIYNYPTGAIDPAVGNLSLSFTMAADKNFKLELNAVHGALSWNESYTVSIAGATPATSSIIAEQDGVWQVFSIDAKKDDVVTITANCQSLSSGTIMSAMAFDAVPEPSTIVLLVMGIIGLLAYAWRKRK